MQATVSHRNDRSIYTRKLRVPPYLPLRHCSRSYGISMVTPCCQRAEFDGTSTHDDCLSVKLPPKPIQSDLRRACPDYQDRRKSIDEGRKNSCNDWFARYLICNAFTSLHLMSSTKKYYHLTTTLVVISKSLQILHQTFSLRRSGRLATILCPLGLSEERLNDPRSPKA